jgi:protein-disulfide isomerase
LDIDYLKGCIENNTYLPMVVDDTYSGMLAGVSSTPTFVIGDKKISGALPFSIFKNIIENQSMEIEDIESAGKSIG